MKHTPTPWHFKRQEVYEESAQLTGKSLQEHEGYFRENDGTWVISADDGRIAGVAFRGKAKHGEAWRTADPEGMANARLIVDCVNICNGNPEAIKELIKAAKELIKKIPQGHSEARVAVGKPSPISRAGNDDDR